MEMALLIENKSHGETEKRIVSNYNKIKFASARSFRRSERARDGKIFSLFIIKTDTFLLLACACSRLSCANFIAPHFAMATRASGGGTGGKLLSMALSEKVICLKITFDDGVEDSVT